MIPIALVIVLANGGATPNSVLLDVVFRNVSENSIRILKRFSDDGNLPIWFQLHMTSADGSPVTGIRGAGKINLREQLDYVTLRPGETFSVRLNAAKLVTTPLTPGNYKVSLTYRNQYGQDCFKGQVQSNTIDVILKRDTREPATDRR